MGVLQRGHPTTAAAGGSNGGGASCPAAAPVKRIDARFGIPWCLIVNDGGSDTCAPPIATSNPACAHGWAHASTGAPVTLAEPARARGRGEGAPGRAAPRRRARLGAAVR